jgi:hypothetical protein
LEIRARIVLPLNGAQFDVGQLDHLGLGCQRRQGAMEMTSADGLNMFMLSFSVSVTNSLTVSHPADFAAFNHFLIISSFICYSPMISTSGIAKRRA